ncbi:ribbon-helix-helix protein, CopG family [candidate division KSB1 bacterium]|nr:ribbon-helix-helix protein, CopG family [candidate division KSB1 bacterium]
MKTKIGTILDEELVKKLKERSNREDRSMSDILHEALQGYFQKGPRQRELRLAAVDNFCSKPFNLPDQEIQKLLVEEYFEQ